VEFDLTTLVVIGTDCIGSCKYNWVPYDDVNGIPDAPGTCRCTLWIGYGWLWWIVDYGLATDDYGGLWMFIATVNNNSITLWRINLVMRKTRVDVSGNLPQIFYHTSW